jgi:hypothetical protein
LSSGPTGERGKTGDHGQRGDTGDVGDRGPTGRIGETGETGEAGGQGRPGRIGDTGETGARGIPGEPGKQGMRGRSLTWVQALVMFGLVVLIGVSMGFALERQQHRLEQQQQLLGEQQARSMRNSERISENRYQSCLNGVRIIERFNDQLRELAEIERRNTRDPLARDRVRAYESGIQPIRACQR